MSFFECVECDKSVTFVTLVISILHLREWQGGVAYRLMQPTYLIVICLLIVVIGVLTVLWRREKAKLIKQRESSAKALSEGHFESVRERDRLLDSVGHAYLLVNSTSHIQFTNSAARELLKGRDLEGRTIIEAFLDEKLAVALLKCIRTGKPVQEKVILRSQVSPLGKSDYEGGSAWMIEASPHLTDDHEMLTCVIIRNITAEHESEQIRQDFVANASHELRTPMAIIQGYLENLLDDDMLEEPVLSRRFLGVMQKHSNRISRIVEDMLAISKLESGADQALKKAPFLLNDCVDDVVDRLSSLVAQNKVELKVRIDPRDLTVLGDGFYFAQVLFNLVENALKQNSAPGLEIEVAGKVVDQSIVITVSDNGRGIPSEALPYIFKRFYRVEKHHTNSEVKGTGLGLSIVKRAVEAHDGSITVVSTPGVRTTFTITLPVQES